MTGQGMMASFPRCSLEMKLSPASFRTMCLNFKENLGIFVGIEKGYQGKQGSLIHDLLRVRIDDILDQWQLAWLKEVPNSANLDNDCEG